MRKDNRFFLMALCAAAFLHGGALFLAPDFSRRKPQAAGDQKALPIELKFSPAPRPAPPAAKRPEPLRPEPVAESKALSERVETEPVAERIEAAPAVAEAADSSFGSFGSFDGDPDPQARQNFLLQYQGTIRLMIDRQKEYPYQARRQEQEGKVEIHFVLSRQGHLVGEPALSRKSRYERLNASALEAVKRAAPYPPFPPEVPAEELNFSVTLTFSLSGSTS
jgi:protein TonB